MGFCLPFFNKYRYILKTSTQDVHFPAIYRKITKIIREIPGFAGNNAVRTRRKSFAIMDKIMRSEAEIKGALRQKACNEFICAKLDKEA